MELSDQMKALLKDLGLALHEALTKDLQIKSITDEIKSNGYDIYLIMEANIALDKRESNAQGHLFLRSPEDQQELEMLEFNNYDKDFLSSMKIKIDE